MQLPDYWLDKAKAYSEKLDISKVYLADVVEILIDMRTKSLPDGSEESRYKKDELTTFISSQFVNFNESDATLDNGYKDAPLVEKLKILNKVILSFGLSPLDALFVAEVALGKEFERTPKLPLIMVHQKLCQLTKLCSHHSQMYEFVMEAIVEHLYL